MLGDRTTSDEAKICLSKMLYLQTLCFMAIPSRLNRPDRNVGAAQDESSFHENSEDKTV